MEMFDIFNQLKYLMREMELDEEFFEIQARMTKKMFDAYVEQGFTREEALTLIAKLGNGLNPDQR